MKNGYKLAHHFRRIRKKLGFSNVEADLFYELVAICNDEDWPDSFQYPNALLCATIGVSEKTLISARNRLKQAGLIGFTSGHKRNPSTYSFLPLPEVSKSGSKNDSVSGSRTGTNTSDSFKTKIKTKKREGTPAPESSCEEVPGMKDSPPEPAPEAKENKRPGGKLLNYPFPTKSFVSLWRLWKQYKREQHSFSYKSQVTEQKALDLLQIYDEDFATLIIERAMAKGWKGFIFPETADEYDRLRAKPLNGLQFGNSHVKKMVM